MEMSMFEIWKQKGAGLLFGALLFVSSFLSHPAYGVPDSKDGSTNQLARSLSGCPRRKVL